MNKQLYLLSVVRYAFQLFPYNLATGTKKTSQVILNIYLVFWQLNNLELAVNLAKRGNLPGAEELVCICLIFILKFSDYHCFET